MIRRGPRLFNPRWNAAVAGPRAAVPGELVDLLALLRASFMVYRNAHWQVSGDGYYAKHQLLQRIYEDSEKHVDQVAERMVGYYGGDSVALAGKQSDRLQSWIETIENSSDCPIERSLEAAKLTRQALENSYKTLKKDGQISLGWDDLLMTISSAKDEHVYLLQQTLEGHEVKLVDRAANPTSVRKQRLMR